MSVQIQILNISRNKESPLNTLFFFCPAFKGLTWALEMIIFLQNQTFLICSIVGKWGHMERGSLAEFPFNIFKLVFSISPGKAGKMLVWSDSTKVCTELGFVVITLWKWKFLSFINCIYRLPSRRVDRCTSGQVMCVTDFCCLAEI